MQKNLLQIVLNLSDLFKILSKHFRAAKVSRTEVFEKRPLEFKQLTESVIYFFISFSSLNCFCFKKVLLLDTDKVESLTQI